MFKKYIVSVIAVVALVVGLIALGLHGSQPVQTLGAPTNIVGSTFTSGIGFGSGTTPINVNWAGDKIYAKSNQAYWKNTTGMTQYVDYAEFDTDNTASSSYKIYVMATTSPLRTLYDFTAPTSSNGKMMINGFAIATSSTATTTTNLSGNGSQDTTVQVPDGSYVVYYLTALNGTLCASQGGQCESATSTNRGFNAYWRLRYHN
jgi:hypothetical protein